MNERKPDDSPLPPSELLSLDHSQLYMRRKLTSSDSNLSVYNFDLLSDENPHIPEDNAPLQGSFSSIVDTYNNLEYTPNRFVLIILLISFWMMLSEREIKMFSCTPIDFVLFISGIHATKIRHFNYILLSS